MNRLKVSAKRAGSSCQELFISEYIEAQPKNKAIEIYNPGSTPVDLSDYYLGLFMNGASTPINIDLIGSVAPKEVFVITHPQAEPKYQTKKDMSSNKLNFNGDDAVVLKKQDNRIDKVGKIGVQPGQNGWQVGSGTTKDRTIVRKVPCDKGEMNWDISKGRWDLYPFDFTGNLGKHISTCANKASDKLNFSFGNPQETISGSTRYFEFDVLASASNSGTYFDNCVLRISYDTIAFGSNVVANNNLTVTKAPAYNTVTYVDPDTISDDDSPSVMDVPFGTDPNESSWFRTEVPTSPGPILHFKLKIDSCAQNSGLSYTDTSFVDTFSRYTDNPDDTITNWFSYDETNYLNELDKALCDLEITNFTSPVYPGTWYQGTTNNKWELVIEGEGFGNTRGSGNVYFKNADTAFSAGYIPLDSTDIQNWTDTEIKVRMPSILNTGTSTNPVVETPGSGNFYVKTDIGDSVISNTPIDMPYAVKNAYFTGNPSEKHRMDLANVDKTDSASVTFKFDTSITKHDSAAHIKAIIKKALRDWRCETLVYFKAEGDTAIGKSDPDDVSLIYLSETLAQSGALGNTDYPALVQCFDNGGDKHVFPKEIDIGFARSPKVGSWYYDTLNNALPSNKFDFYEIALHEVGHADLLDHVFAPTPSGNSDELMLWKGQKGPVSGSQRKFIDGSAANGGFNVVALSESLNLDTTSCSAPVGETHLAPDKSCGVTGTGPNDPKGGNNGFTLYPNPAGDRLKLSFQISRSSDVELRIYDHTGRVVRQLPEMHFNAPGTYKEEINVSGLASGLYVLYSEINGNVRSFKMIKR